MAAKFSQGGDAKAIAEIADTYYGGYGNMFERNGWPESGSKVMTTAPAHIVETYGSIAEFAALHQRNGLMFPIEAIKSNPPNVWLTSFYGFKPEEWGFLGFYDESRRNHFLKNSRPGVLVVIYGATGASKNEVGRVLGIQQCSHHIGSAQKFMPHSAWTSKERNPLSKGQWDYAVKTTRAWRVRDDTPMYVGEFAPQTYDPDRGQAIGTWGMQLTFAESQNIFRLSLEEVDVFGEAEILSPLAGRAREVLAPSKAGPVSQCPFVTTESEGPKHLYILKLIGDADAFLGEPANGKIIVKAGFSGAPETRCNDHNRTLPKKCAFSWEVLFSGEKSLWQPYPSSVYAKVGERAMHRALNQFPKGTSLGGEFFLADADLIETAWQTGNRAAKDFKR